MKRLEPELKQNEQTKEEMYPVKTVAFFQTKALTEELECQLSLRNAPTLLTG